METTECIYSWGMYSVKSTNVASVQAAAGMGSPTKCFLDVVATWTLKPGKPERATGP